VTRDDFEWQERRPQRPAGDQPAGEPPGAPPAPAGGPPQGPRGPSSERTVYGRRGGEWRRVEERRAARGGRGGGESSEGRRLLPAGYVLLVVLVGLGLAALLNARDLARSAESLPVGSERTVMMALTRPITAISSFLRIDRPRAYADRALGRADQTQSGVHHRTTPHHHPTSTPSGTASPGTSPSPAWTPSKDEPLALWVGGDSMAMVFGQSLVALSDRTGVIESVLDYHVSSGLSRPDFFDWPARLRAEMKSYDPDVAVAMFGANDGQNVEYQGQVLTYPSKPWLDLYHKRVGEAMDLLGGTEKRQVWWVGMPTARNAEQSAIYKTLDTVYAAEAKKRPNVHWVDTYAMFADKSGQYSDYLPGLSGKTELMRQSDGIHWTRAGGDLAATAVLDQIRDHWHIKQ
jgi:hypothetical protein